MKKLFFLVPAILITACGKDSNIIEPENENGKPQLTAQTFTINEHSEAGTSIGSITATDSDNDELTFTINSESGLVINETTGEVRVGDNLILDFEANATLPFTVSVFDGKAIVERDFELSINDVSEFDLLTDEQKEVIQYFKYLTLWEAPTHIGLASSSRWEEPMKLYLDGQISTQFRQNVEEVLAEYNTIFENSDFNISLVENLQDSNAHLYFGEASEIESLWDDMFEIIDGATFSGYAITSNNNSVLSDSRIWVSSTVSVLFQHELGHALGFGHSDKCDVENSFMCSSIAPEHDFLEIEKDVLAYAYDNDIPAGLTSQQIEEFLANIMILED